MSGVLETIHIVRVKRAVPEPLAEALLQPGRGVPGDHHDRKGIRRAITLIALETLDDVGRALGLSVEAGASRRNLGVRGLGLDALAKGTRLAIGEARLEVLGPCDPCSRMEKAIGPAALERMTNRGGLIAKVIQVGKIRRGDTVCVLDPEQSLKIDQRTVSEPSKTESASPDGSPFATPATPRALALNAALLSWFRENQRDLPWRRTRDAYAIWVSEVMLQQTRVATVIPFWERFLQRFPDVGALAAAPLDDVLALWSGLGYYARARHLHRAAQAVVERHAGVFPADLALLLALPGFGPYTAGAVGSIALGLDAALVDGNVARVICRFEGWTLGAEAARDRAWLEAPGLVARGEAGDWNQALMELGATVCTPAVPRCPGCPVRALCASAARGEPATYPLARVRKPRKRLRFVALAIREGEGVFLLRRADKGLFGGLWELPSTVVESGESVDVAHAAAEQLFRRVSLAPLGRVEQALTHRDVEVDVFAATGTGFVAPEGGQFVAAAELRAFGLGTLAVRVLRAAGVEVPDGHGRRRAVSTGQRTLL